MKFYQSIQISISLNYEPINFAQIQSIIPNERTAILEWYLQDDNFQTFIITQQSDLPSVWQSSAENGSGLSDWLMNIFKITKKIKNSGKSNSCCDFRNCSDTTS
jgi:hypothetical protein